MMPPDTRTPPAPSLPAGRTATDDAARWAAVLARDRSADGRFVYSVRSTGIFCRPSCPARRPNPENVAFHDSPDAARSAGFRPCMRCRPEAVQAGDEPPEWVARLCRHIAQADGTPPLAELAAIAGLSPSHLQRRFKANTGLSPREYALAIRADRLRERLAAGAASVTEAIHAAGFGSSSRFYERSDDMLGMTPTAYRKGGANQLIHFASGRCTLGLVLVASGDRGICAILLGDDTKALLADLARRFPNAHLTPAEAGFEATVAAVIRLVDDPARGTALPLDLRGTAFQQQVWKALQAIPAGQTASYTELANRVGRPRAVRAVAAACAANPIAVAVPCHRALRSDGALAGYRWGLARKRALLARERAAAAAPGADVEVERNVDTQPGAGTNAATLAPSVGEHGRHPGRR